MRTYYDIDLGDRSIRSRTVQGEDAILIGRYLIAKTLVETGVATVDPLGPDNPLIFSAGPFAGTTFSNANRTSVGCKSPLTGGIKEANGGGTFAYALGQLNVSGFTLHGQSAGWLLIHFRKGGAIEFHDAAPYLGKGNMEVAELLYQRFGKKVSLGLNGPVGEYAGLIAGIAFSDKDGRPTRMAARGGVGAVMGSKRVKAIVVDMDRMPLFSDPKKVNSAIKDYTRMLREDSVVMNFYNKVGTMGMADYQNYIGGIPVRNFTGGQLANVTAGEQFRMGGDFIGELNTSRGGQQTHPCMPGCAIQCSNVYHDADGKEVVSPVEYETLGLLGTNCGLSHPDDLAAVNAIANDLGVDTIELGAMIGVLMDAGVGEFGDLDFMTSVLAEIRKGSEQGKLWAQGTWLVGQHYGSTRIPTIKKQGISAYDPRVVECTGITMQTTAQGADHTAGNLPRLKTREMSPAELMQASFNQQVKVAANDSLGLCAFGQTVTNNQLDFLTDALNAAFGTALTKAFFERLGQATLRYEREFNQAAGFTAADDELPAFFYQESLPPTNQVARFHGEDLHGIYDGLPA